MAKISLKKLKLNDFHVIQVVEHTQDSFRTTTFKNENFQKKLKNSIFGQFLPILATFMK
jgi:hypothetical protein